MLPFDHESNIGPWLALKERGVFFRTWNIDSETLMPKPEDLGRLMTARTRLVCVTHASNLLGSINPIRAIADFVHEHGALICVDIYARWSGELPDEWDESEIPEDPQDWDKGGP